MSVAIDYINFDERMVGANSPDYDDTLNRALQTVVSASGAVDATFGGFALRPTVAPSIGQFYRATDTDVGASWQTLTTAMISDITSASTGITKVGTVNTGVWQGTSIATTYTDAKVKTVTGTTNRLDIGGTATDPTFNISTSYVGQATIVTLGTVTTGTWTATVIGTAYTTAQVVDVTGTAARITIGGTATHPTVDIASTYVGQNSITTLGTVTTGTWTATAIANAYIASGLDVTKLTAGTTLPSNVILSSLTSLGTIATGVWNGTSITTTYTDAKIKTVTGTANRLTIGGTSTDPTFDISSAYVGQATITTLGTVTTGTWAATAITVDKGGTNLTSFTIGDIVYASGATTLSKLAIGTAAQILITNGSATAPAWHTLATADITDLTTAATGITRLGTVTTGIWNASVIPALYGGTGVNNGSSTITLGGAFTTSGAFALTLTVTAGTNVTLPTTGTLINSAVTSLASLASVGGAFAISGAFTGATTGAFSSTLSTSQLTITDTASRIIPGTTSLSLRNNANNADNVMVSDAGAVTIRAGVAATTATFTGAMTYGGVTLSNAVTGTGNMVLSVSPTLTGTVIGAASTWSGVLTANAAINGTTATFATQGATLTLGVSSANGGAALTFLGATSGIKNWRIDTNVTSGVDQLSFTPSTANGGTTFTTPVFTLTSGGTGAFGAEVSAATNLKNLNGVAEINGNANSNGYVIRTHDTDTGVHTNETIRFLRNNSEAGNISTTLALVTTYNSTSDDRLKVDLGEVPSLILPDLRIRYYVRKLDGSREIGVFAQEAYPITRDKLPNFITPGTDELDAKTGLPVKPWQADWAKMGPELVLGWQYHASVLAKVNTRLDRLEKAVFAE